MLLTRTSYGYSSEQVGSFDESKGVDREVSFVLVNIAIKLQLVCL